MFLYGYMEISIKIVEPFILHLHLDRTILATTFHVDLLTFENTECGIPAGRVEIHISAIRQRALIHIILACAFIIRSILDLLLGYKKTTNYRNYRSF